MQSPFDTKAEQTDRQKGLALPLAPLKNKFSHATSQAHLHDEKHPKLVTPSLGFTL